jgi:hypothetical protein
MFNAATPSIDIRFESHGSIVLISALSEAGQDWLDETSATTRRNILETQLPLNPGIALPFIRVPSNQD